jgi:hypothetical protein
MRNAYATQKHPSADQEHPLGVPTGKNAEYGHWATGSVDTGIGTKRKRRSMYPLQNYGE